MNLCHAIPDRPRTALEKVRAARAWTFIEMLIAMAIFSVFMAMVGALSVYGLRSYVAIGNYVDLDAKSRNALDRMTRDIRQAAQVTGYSTNSSFKWLTFKVNNMDVTGTNVQSVTSITYTWDGTARTIICAKTGEPTKTYLTECDDWNFALYQRTPHTNLALAYFPATNAAGVYDVALCKLVDMNWKCSRTMLGKKVNTESVQTAQIVLRNKP